jgi:hypothetical protein
MDQIDKLNRLIAQVDEKLKNKPNLDGDLNENRNLKGDYEVYHGSYTSAINTALSYAINKGYTTDDDEVGTKIGLGPRKPDEGKTNRFSITLYKNQIEQRKMLHIQVYNMGNGRYELNAYIN